MAVKSPCIGVCILDPAAHYCSGCYRTGDEIAAWITASDGQKKRILTLVRQRREQAATRAKADAP